LFKVLAVELGTWWGKCVASWGGTCSRPSNGDRPKGGAASGLCGSVEGWRTSSQSAARSNPRWHVEPTASQLSLPSWEDSIHGGEVEDWAPRQADPILHCLPRRSIAFVVFYSRVVHGSRKILKRHMLCQLKTLRFYEPATTLLLSIGTLEAMINFGTKPGRTAA
jgi:hypothetical protein